MASPQLPFEEVSSNFTAKSRQTYANMKARFAEKQNKKGRITRIGREIPFSLEEFRGWLLVKLGGENGAVKCRYCAEYLTADTMVVDHSVPAAQGGSLDLDNLDLICKRDNDQKGGMCADSYESLLDWSALNMRSACRGNMLHRLAIAVQLAAQQRWQIIQKAKQSKAAAAPEQEEPW